MSRSSVKLRDMLTIKELTQAVGHGATPRMVRHYHQIGLLPLPIRSHSNYRLYSEADVQRLQRIVALKQQGFQLSHIKQMLAAQPEATQADSLVAQLQLQYQTVFATDYQAAADCNGPGRVDWARPCLPISPGGGAGSIAADGG